MKCKNCGAARKLNDEQCEYCDAYFYVPEDKRIPADKRIYGGLLSGTYCYPNLPGPSPLYHINYYTPPESVY
jgi:hypothetical protein